MISRNRDLALIAENVEKLEIKREIGKRVKNFTLSNMPWLRSVFMRFEALMNVETVEFSSTTAVRVMSIDLPRLASIELLQNALQGNGNTIERNTLTMVSECE